MHKNVRKKKIWLIHSMELSSTRLHYKSYLQDTQWLNHKSREHKTCYSVWSYSKVFQFDIGKLLHTE